MGKVCIIPARGGSKRIPRKNIRHFFDKPIIAYSIEAALDSGLFEEVMVSTDDKEIAEIALKYGAKVPFMRSEQNSNDFATTQDVLVEVLRAYGKLNIEFEYTCCLYPCAPLVSIDSLKEGFSILESNKFDTVLSVTRFDFPIQRSLKIKDLEVSFVYPEHQLTRSQDLEETYHDAGQFYCLKSENILKQKPIITEKTGCVILDDLHTQDIDNDMDWEMAELKFKKINNIT